MIVPERSDRIRKISLPAWFLKVAAIVGATLLLILALGAFDYLHMLGQVAENKNLRVENHKLKLDIQAAQTKVESLDETVSRLKTFASKLKVIANLDQPGSQPLLDKIPDAGRGGGKGGSPQFEDSGNIEDEDSPTKDLRKKNGASLDQESSPEWVPSKNANIHERLEYQRSKSVAVEGIDLSEQIQAIEEAAVKLRVEAEQEERNLATLQEQLQDRMYRLLSTPSIAPAQGYVSSEFGYRYNPFSGVRTFHAGMDIANSIGAPINAPADGRVVKVGFSGGFGTVVKIDHGYGVATKYGHLARAHVQPGQRVRRGERIAEMGNSGRSTGPHVHYQVEINGRPVQPRLFILDF